MHIVRGIQWRDPHAASNTYDAFSPAVPYESDEPLQHYVCVHEQSETAIYQQWKADIENGSVKPVDDWKHKNECIVEFQCNEPFCAEKESHQEENSGKKLQLALLRTCRQVYVEANPLLWTTNTFSFGEVRLLRDFVAQRNMKQKQLLKKIHLDWNIASRSQSYFDRLPLYIIKALRGLQIVHLNMVTSDSSDDAYLLINHPWTNYNRVPDILLLRILPLTAVTVTYNILAKPAANHVEMPPILRLEFAQYIRSQLLNPEGLN